MCSHFTGKAPPEIQRSSTWRFDHCLAVGKIWEGLVCKTAHMSRYFWSLGHPFIIWEPVFVSGGKGAGDESLSEFQDSGPSDERENIVSQP